MIQVFKGFTDVQNLYNQANVNVFKLTVKKLYNFYTISLDEA